MKVLLIWLLMGGAALLSSAGWIVSQATRSNRPYVLAHARGILEIYARSRQVYSELRCNEHDPLPIEFSRRLARCVACANVQIYSPYPFPSTPPHSGGGLQNEFQKEAWKQLSEKGELEFISWGSNTLKYAIPDRMGPSCVECHNTHPDSPKTDWKIGDVRGVLAVELPY